MIKLLTHFMIAAMLLLSTLSYAAVKTTGERFELWCQQHPQKCLNVQKKCNKKPGKCEKIKRKMMNKLLRYEKQCLDYPGSCENIKTHLKTKKAWCQKNPSACKKVRKERKAMKKACEKKPLNCIQNIELDSFPTDEELDDPSL